MGNDLVPQPAPDQILIYRDGDLKLRVRLAGQTVWLTQRLIADLFQVSIKTANEHLSNIFEERELEPATTIRKFRIVQSEGSRQVSRSIDHYSLEAVLAVGYRVRSNRGTAFRQWATERLSELLIKGFTLDDERMKNGRTLGNDYFDELLERIRDIRASERLFYQKITDIYATSIDYDSSAEITQNFFATVQNKLHWAIHGHTAAEIIRYRADAGKPNMGLTTWRNAPQGPIRRADVTVAKNYLGEQELRELNRIVSMYLDYAEVQARRQRPMHMIDWASKLDAFLQFNEWNVLSHAGAISHQLAEKHALQEFEKYDAHRLRLAAEQPTSDFDRVVAQVKHLVEGKRGQKPGQKAAGKKRNPEHNKKSSK